uniref:Uncharacterized protein n=1 Tax=Rhizophagus irregularis (strain DAOM 181602 / DAOM 197198 / MUCL 43194) TaxID=747089 RepID=U9SND7_RHIID
MKNYSLCEITITICMKNKFVFYVVPSVVSVVTSYIQVHWTVCSTLSPVIKINSVKANTVISFNPVLFSPVRYSKYNSSDNTGWDLRQMITDEHQTIRCKLIPDASHVKWISLFTKFREVHSYSNDIVELDNKPLFDQLEQFLVEIRKSNAREISEIFEKIRVINLFDTSQFKSLHRPSDGHIEI